MKKRYAGGAGVLVALGILIGNFWKIPGLGSGNTLSPPASPQQSNSTPAENSDEEDADESEINSSTQANLGNTDLVSRPVEPEPPKELVTVVVHNNRFRVSSDGDPHTGIDLEIDQIVKMAKEVEGNNRNIKVRLMFYQNAQEGAIADLRKALREAEISQGEIQEISEFVD